MPRIKESKNLTGEKIYELLETETIFGVLFCYFEEFKEKVEKLNKRAKKLGCSLITFTVLDEYVESKEVRMEGGFLDTEVSYRYLLIDVQGTAPKFSGWQFLGTIETKRVDDKKMNILREVPGYSIPERYRDTGSFCEHCETKRYRKDTFIVFNENTKEYKQVGRQCLKDFLGHIDPKYVAARLSFHKIMKQFCEDGFFEEGGGRFDIRHIEFELEHVLAITNRVIEKVGWIPRSKADCFTIATADIVSSFLSATLKPSSRRTDYDKDLIKKFSPNEKDTTFAKEANEWALTLIHRDRISNYIYSLAVLAEAKHIGFNDIGLAASMIGVYRRELAKEQESKINLDKSEYVGELKQRTNFELTVIKYNAYPNDFGVSHVYKFVDSNNNQFVWSASREQDLAIGDSLTLKGTIKAHYIDKAGVKNTKISHCVLIS